ncbi:MAG TPA: class I SAM-dependent methyltransferase [Chitinophagaceae bacterium]|nr:class I SAM-dependent methyltransferase [Chitinophagaceae bacterium]
MKDNFSGQASSYAQYRPGYPTELFDFILAQTKKRDWVWDCATGNGQTAKELAPYFKKVFATDISEKQLANAVHLPNIFYSVQAAEQTDFENNSFDLVTVSQALHWFNFDLFYKELHRVTVPGGWFAAWMYGGMTITPAIDALKSQHHDVTLGEYWDPERKFVNDNYETIPFPLKEISCPVFSMSYQWSLEELKGYFNTWSALQKFIALNHYNPVDELMEEIKHHWKNERMTVSFPLHLRMGQVRK